MASIKIVFVLPDLSGGGAQRVMLALAGGLDQAQFSVHLIVLGRDETLAGEIPPDVSVERILVQRLRTALPPLVSTIRRMRPDILVSVMGYLNLAMLATRFLHGCNRIVVREANVLSITAASLPRWVPYQLSYQRLYPSAAAIIAPTKLIADEIRQVAPRAASRVCVIDNPVNEALLRQRVPSPLCTGEGYPILVAAGRLVRQKGFDRLIDLMPQLPPGTRLTIYGEGPERRALEAQISSLKVSDRVKLAGFSPELPAAVAGADLFVLPSRWEGLPNVALEALALGTPVVASEEATVDDLARRAAAGAVTIAPLGGAFAAAIGRHVALPATHRALRPSLLPPAYRRERVVQEFSNLLHRLAPLPRSA